MRDKLSLRSKSAIGVAIMTIYLHLALAAGAQIDGPTDEITLKDQYQLEKSTAIRNAQNCQELANEFNQQQLDRFTANGYRILGVDLHGKIFELKRSKSGICNIITTAKLGTPFTTNETGETEKMVYYYEPNSLCVYRQVIDTRYNGQNRVRRICHQPLGIVNKYAPYTSP